MKPRISRYFAFVIAIMILSSRSGDGQASPPNPSPPSKKEGKPRIDIDLDKESAIKIAEIVLVRVYGESVLGERPWHVSKTGSVFKIEGTLHNDTNGGVATMEIDKANGQVLSIIHGK